MLKELIDEYYKSRGLVQPDSKQALLFLMSEFGELCDAYSALYNSDELGTQGRTALQMFVLGGRLADKEVSNQAGWVRNNDRLSEQNIVYEIGDVLMMLERFCGALTGEDPIQAMTLKMQKNGSEIYYVEGRDWGRWRIGISGAERDAADQLNYAIAILQVLRDSGFGEMFGL